MSQIFVKNLNVTKLQKDFCKEFSQVNLDSPVAALIKQLANDNQLNEHDIGFYLLT